jgi:hypothetical protein
MPLTLLMMEEKAIKALLQIEKKLDAVIGD